MVQRVLTLGVCLAAVVTAVVVQANQTPAGSGPNVDWAVYGGTPEQTRYSPLAQITTKNVNQLRVAWQFDPADGPPGRFQVNPIIIDGTLYTITPGGRVVALDGATGTIKWSWNSGTRAAGRGVTYWSSGSERRLLASFGRYIYALNPLSGERLVPFGRDGRIDLHQDLGRDPELQSVGLATPGVIYRDTYIVGGRTSEGLPASPGDIRAYDVRTGHLKWSFHTIPRPGEFGYETWPTDAWAFSGSANSWAGMAVDTRRGIVFAPTGSAAPDFYGASRLGDNLFANSLLALDAETGRRIWHFQAVRHDIWDRDFPSPPTLVTVRHDGRTVDAVAQATKHGYVFLFDRVSGTPLFPIENRDVPPSTVPGEVAAPRQPFPTRPAPFARQRLTEDMLTTRTPEAHAWALQQFRQFRSGGQFVPLAVGQETVVFPGFDGGAEWGGSAYDASTGLLYINANDIPWSSSLRPAAPAVSLGRQTYATHCAACHGDTLQGQPGFPPLTNLSSRMNASDFGTVVRSGRGRMVGFPALPGPAVNALAAFVLSGGVDDSPTNPSTPTDLPYIFTGYHRFYDPDGYPAVVPPWGTLNAINLHTGEYAWKIPFGEYPELAAQGLTNTGSENYGGPIVTGGGLLFIGATNFDRKFHAYDKATGRLLWDTTLPNSGNATPATYQVNGKQYVVIAAFGGYGRPSSPARGGAFVAFALP